MSEHVPEASESQFPLKRSDYGSREEYYWTYQYKMAEHYYIPFLSEIGFHLKAKKVLDIGCGLGGFTASLADEGAAQCVGIEIDSDMRRPSKHERPNLTYMIKDITDSDAVEAVGTNYDFIVLHDVIEHIPLVNKERFLRALKRFCGDDTLILITFPPYYSPFGLHQQAILKSVMRMIPFLGWIPIGCLKPILNVLGEDATASDRLREIVDSRMTIRRFKQMLTRQGFQTDHERYYFVRPTHEIRFGWRTRISNIVRIPILNEIINSGALYLVRPA